jgi:hypothetical protein
MSTPFNWVLVWVPFGVEMLPPVFITCVERNHEALAIAGTDKTSKAVAIDFLNMLSSF